MRVIAGTFRGRRLSAVRGRDVRPTSERVREAIFDMLAPWVPQARVLDLFAGTGALGLEALSRGAHEAVFVEKAPAALHVLRANVAALGVAEKVRVLPMPVARALFVLAGERAVFDVALVDPPYRKGHLEGEVVALLESSLMVPGGVVAVEHAATERVPRVRAWKVHREARYGDTAVTVLVREGEVGDGDRSPVPRDV